MKELTWLINVSTVVSQSERMLSKKSVILVAYTVAPYRKWSGW